MRRALLGLTLAVLAVASGAGAQPAGKIARVGVLSVGAAPSADEMARQPLFGALKDLGWAVGQNLVFEPRFAGGRVDRLPSLAAELVQLKVDAILTLSNQETYAAKHATTTIPIIMLVSLQPVENGLVASLSRPGGNVTGLTAAPASFGKYLELLKEAVPGLKRVVVLRDPTFIRSKAKPSYEADGHKAGVEVAVVDVQGVNDIEPALARTATARAGGIVVMLAGPLLARMRDVIDFGLKHRVPTMFPGRTPVDAGGLMSYGYDRAALARRVAWYLDRVLKGTRPADLPVQQPTNLELVVNLRTAKAIGMTLPPALLQRADQVIE